MSFGEKLTAASNPLSARRLRVQPDGEPPPVERCSRYFGCGQHMHPRLLDLSYRQTDFGRNFFVKWPTCVLRSRLEAGYVAAAFAFWLCDLGCCAISDSVAERTRQIRGGRPSRGRSPSIGLRNVIRVLDHSDRLPSLIGQRGMRCIARCLGRPCRPGSEAQEVTGRNRTFLRPDCHCRSGAGSLV